MNDKVKRLQALTIKQHDKIKELELENQDLKTLLRTLEIRIQDLEETRMAIDFATAEIPVDLDLIPEDANGHSNE
ncbi:MAG: hypothetical protein OEO19_17085 [Gammaproteobacteria bacterium]|nr:hypothetical protein [Gammaproteobacteria bacterium]MDH3449815.1 hypothetical protein [Gammaproteobacteria bacterium]